MFRYLPSHALVLIFDPLSPDSTTNFKEMDIGDGTFSSVVNDFIFFNESVFYDPYEDEDNFSKGARTLTVFGNTILIYGFSKETIYESLTKNLPNTHFLLLLANDLSGVLTPEMYAFFLEEDHDVAALSLNSKIRIKRKS